MKVLGIHSSPVVQGNTSFLLDAVLAEASGTDGVSAESVALHGLTIADCNQCNACMGRLAPPGHCAIEDEAQLVARARWRCTT